MLEARVRSVPAQGEWRRIFHRTSGIDDSCSCWTRSQTKNLSTHRDTSDIQRPPRHEANANPKVRLSPRCEIIPSETHNAWQGGCKLRLFLVAQRANSVRNNELEQWTSVTEDSGDVLQYQGQRRTRTLELSLEENDSSRRRGEGSDWHWSSWTEQPRGVWWGVNQATITVTMCVGLFAALATPIFENFESNVVDVGGNVWQDERLKARENVGSEMTNSRQDSTTSSD